MRKKYNEIFSYDGKFYHVTGKIFDVLAVNIFWIIGCIPIVTAGASFSAMYYTLSNSVKNNRKDITVAFWGSFRQNFVESIKLWLIIAGAIFAFLWNLGIVNAKIAGNIGIFFMVLYSICLIFFIAIACYAFPALSRFDEPIGWIIKLSIYLVIKHIGITLVLCMMLAACYFAIMYNMALIFILPGVASYFSSMMIDPILDKHMPNEEKVENEL